MTKNMGFIDRTVRLLGVALIAMLYFAGRIDGTLAFVLGIVAVVFFMTSVIGWCPLYSVVGVSTRKAASTSPAKP
jgi:hypothetical protein